MKNRVSLAVLGLAVTLFLTITASARGSGIDPKYVPPDAKWAIHLDVDALTRSKLWAMLGPQMNIMLDQKHFTLGMRTDQPPSQAAAAKVKALSQALGIQLPDDLHGITLVGRSFDENGVLLLVKAKVDRDRLIGMAKLDPQYKSTTYRGTEIATMGDDSGVTWAFLADDVAVLARTTDDVKRAIDSTMATGNTAPTASLLTGAEAFNGASIMLYSAAEGLQELQQEQQLSPILAPVTRVQASIGERGEDLVLRAVLTVKSDESARQVRGALEGIRALATLAAMDNKNSQLQMISDLAARATVSTGQQEVTVDWPVSLSTVQITLENLQGFHKAKKMHPATQPATSFVPG